MSLNQPYVVVTRLNSGTGLSTLWVNPTSESSPSVTATDGSIQDTVAYFSLRQDTGIGTNQIDNLIVSGSFFSDVVPAIVRPPLGIQRSGSDVILSWNNPLFALQSASTVSGPYTDVPGASSPYPYPISGSQQCFRLRY